MTKPIFPYAPGQSFKNSLAYKPGPARTSQVDLFRGCLGIPGARSLVTTPDINEVRFMCGRGRSIRYSRGLPEKDVGIPIFKDVADNVFGGLESDGAYRNMKPLRDFFGALNTPFIQFDVLRDMSPRFGHGYVIRAGRYISLCQGGGVGETMVVRYPLNGSGPGVRLLMPSLESLSHRLAMYNLADIFVPFQQVSPRNAGIFLLPPQSVVWAWSSGKWIAGVVESAWTDEARSKMSWMVAAVEDGEILARVAGTEIQVHKKVASLIKKDEVRVAAHGISGIEPYALARSKFDLGEDLLALLAGSYDEPALDTYKMRLMGSTAFKNMGTFREFVDGLSKSGNAPTLRARSVRSVCGDAHELAKEWAVIAAKAGTPLFWGYVTATSADPSCFGGRELEVLGLSHQPYQRYVPYLATALGITSGAAAEQQKKHEISIVAKKVETVTRITIVAADSVVRDVSVHKFFDFAPPHFLRAEIANRFMSALGNLAQEQKAELKQIGKTSETVVNEFFEVAPENINIHA